MKALGFAALVTACTAAEPVATHPEDGKARLTTLGGEDTGSSCEASVQAQDVYCTEKPLGNPGAECAEFGLEPLGKDDNLSGLTFTATRDAYVAIVKSGTHGCGPGNSAYRIYVDVQAGDVLNTPVDQGISHVTYCGCGSEPPPPPPPPPEGYCGDGIVQTGEECDDGNKDDSDMCTSKCTWNTPGKPGKK